MAVVERLALLVTADTTQAVRSLGQVEGSANKLGATTPRLSQVGQTLTRTLTPAALAAGAAFGQAFNKFDAGADALRAAGASGDEFTESMKNVASQVPESFGEVGTVMGELYQRTRLTGPALEDLTQQVIELGRLGQNASVDQLTRVFGDWGIEAEDAAGSIDTLYRVTQETGTGVDKLSDLVVRFGAPLREMGYGFEDAAMLMGQFEASGVNTQLVMGGLRTALGQMAAAGEDPVQTFARVVDSIQNAGSAAEANSLSMELFGRRAGIDMSRAIQEGRFNVDELAASLAANDDTVHEAASGMLDLSDQLKIWQNRLVGVIGPMGEVGMMLSGAAAVAGPVASGLSKIGTAMKAMTVGGAALKIHDTVASLAAMGPVAATAAASVAALAYAWNENQKKEQQFAAGVEAVTQAIKDAGNEVDALSTLVSTSLESSPDMALGLEAIGATAADLETALSGSDAEFESFRDRLEDGSEESQLLAMHLDRMRGMFVEGVEAAGAMDTVLQDVTAAQEDEAQSAEDAAAAHKRATDRIRDQVEVLKELTDTLNSGFSASIDYQNAVLDTTSAVDDLNTAYTDGVTSADDIRRAELDLQAQFQEQSLAAVAVAEAMANLDGRHLSAAEKADIQRAELIKLRDQFPSMIGQIDGMIDALGRVPSKVETKVELNTAEAEAALNIWNGLVGGAARPTGKPPKKSASGGSTNININGAGNPEQVAQRVSRAQRRFALERG